jgi:uncharacterized damage-inducible protein DinB
MDLLQHLRIGAHANRLANRRLQAAMAALSREQFHATQAGFFPSLALTLNHLLAVDIYYLAALRREADMTRQYETFKPCETVAELTERQSVCDASLIAYCCSLSDQDLDNRVDMDRGTYVQTDRVGHVLSHLFMHQTHHRGQAHAMLSGSGLKPPQLDEFLLPSDAQFRVDDMSALGWREQDIYGA